LFRKYSYKLEWNAYLLATSELFIETSVPITSNSQPMGPIHRNRGVVKF